MSRKVIGNADFMINQDQNNGIQLPGNEQNPMTLRLSYMENHVPHLAEALDFMIKKLAFFPSEKFLVDKTSKNVSLELRDESGNILNLKMQKIENKPEFSYIIFYTDDCLRDYHKYTQAGIEFISRPEYTDAGLRVDFIGIKENRYTLLEERIYTDL